ncbi:hypothetical protein CBW24_10980 [Pacificitalea manganoxidans]|uniref:TRAP transporter small permease protein n=1 Tax=Pacificitalea manganoxidans TaxID=1411902 RepID=A0A291M0I2_9RHOB|nr:TRAP transporter small permease [Pacificitalea manganoxidans]ATI42476.1 hypothetical protein CBW24_10980 [Pacificitalea manganoxidans]MAQ46596.1 hypothetical protein [Actibacterium sp.]MDR6307666.1 TRAP-type C4-dicarboxylate transport system permease small subunit [Pacificitalea manganoxidans]|tara:strand:- start:587 stop:1090 length:504 start_codon:yes stop_codon:yes gene_type:complete
MQSDAPDGTGWRRVAANPEIAVSMLLLIAVAGISSLQVVMRYVFNAALPWTEEISGMALVWMTFLGAVGLARLNLHARVEILSEMAAGRTWYEVLEIALDLLGIAFLVCVVIGGTDLVGQLSHERTPALRLPITYQVVAIPLSAGLIALFMALRVIRRIAGIAGRPM